MSVSWKHVALVLALTGLSRVVPSAVAQSDGTDEAFNPLASVEIDLGSQGTYDAAQWAVVFNYTSITIPNGVAVTFKNHPKGAPVVWLATGDVVIDGIVWLDGAPGVPEGAPLPRFSEPGPGGFAGGQYGFSAQVRASGGFGPGGGENGAIATHGSGAGHASAGSGGGSGESGAGGAAYGNIFVSPLIGGSGGAAGGDPGRGGGGAGGGAILIQTPGNIEIGATGQIRANGGQGETTASANGGYGSGGAIRLIAETLSGDGTLRALAGYGGAVQGEGRIRVEVNMNNSNITNQPTWEVSAPGVVFPPAIAPTLTVMKIDTLDLDPDPPAGILTGPEQTINNDGPVTLRIESTNVPTLTVIPPVPGATIIVRIVPYRGDVVEFSSTDLEGNCAFGFLNMQVPNFPRGRSEIQVRAEWDPQVVNTCP